MDITRRIVIKDKIQKLKLKRNDLENLSRIVVDGKEVFLTDLRQLDFKVKDNIQTVYSKKVEATIYSTIDVNVDEQKNVNLKLNIVKAVLSTPIPFDTSITVGVVSDAIDAELSDISIPKKTTLLDINQVIEKNLGNLGETTLTVSADISSAAETDGEKEIIQAEEELVEISVSDQGNVEYGFNYDYGEYGYNYEYGPYGEGPYGETTY